MEYLRRILDLILHIDHHLDGMIVDYGAWIYALMFLIVFCETGLVVTPFLPGDSLLFALGTFAARTDGLSFSVLAVSLIVAAIIGDSVNYWIGSWFGPRIFRGEKIRFLNPKHLERTHEFYERYGGKTIILARFVPIVRTFAPFVAGIGHMDYRRFLLFSVAGAVLWVGVLVCGGYLFGKLPMVQDNFALVIVAIIVFSLVPVAVEYMRARLRR
jgi:membrane-associated protein